MSDKTFDAELSDADLEQAAGGIIGDCTGGSVNPGKKDQDLYTVSVPTKPFPDGGCFPTYPNTGSDI
ncbi:MAG: hypothetical protein AAGI52_10755 [Bacteroidota bacterium]